MSNETSRETDNDTGSDSTLDSTTALPTRRSLRAAARSAASVPAAQDADVAPVEQAPSETAEPTEAAKPVLMVDAQGPTPPALPTMAPSASAPSRARLAARVAATPPPASARTAPTQSRWKSIRSLLVVAIAVPAIFGTVALPAYAFTSEETAAIAPIHDTGAQSLTVPNWTRPVLARDGYSATTAEELAAAAAAKAAAEAAAAAAAAAAQLAASRASDAGGYYNANDTDLSAFVGGGGSWIRPVPGGISSPYGPRGLICNSAGCSNSFHDGTDFSGACGTPIKAVSAGRVTFIGSAGAYGQRVIVDHGGGVESIYGHVQSGSFKVSVGQLVEAGTVVASIGATGVVSGCHLDLKIRLGGSFTNPVPFMAGKGVNL
ncbi:peptidoglycan DD-metalloendopeptidase family protein [Mycetocola sp. 2940]|uniref:peptidoglycan DD-metalloendopeptidase family protein n=1 Tax=Mycetocola sp. 2940 TaxID=3156452 RepID=UPI003398C77F